MAGLLGYRYSLMTGKDVDSLKLPQLNAKDERDIEKIIEHTREQLLPGRTDV